MRIYLFRFVAENRTARHHPQFGNARQVVDDVVSNPLDEILNLKVYVERNDALLKQIQEDVRELRGDFKTILSMR